MNMKYLRNPLVPKSRAWVVGLTLSLLVLASFTLLGNSQPAVTHASGSASSGGASLVPQIGSQAALNNTEVDVIVTWSCVLPQGAQPQFLVITVQLSQQNGSATTSSSATYQNLQPICNGVTDEAEVAVPSPTGGQPFQAGPALVSASFSLGYCSDSSCYDLIIPPTVPAPDETITITSGTDTDLALTDMPADITTSATSSAGAVVDYTPPTAVDEDGPAPAVTCDTPSGSTFPIGPTTVTCTATDSDDTPSTVSQTFTVTVTDLTLPKPDDITQPATSSAGAVVDYTPPTAVDEDGPAPAVTCDTPSGSTFPIGPTTVTCSATDSDSTPSTVSQTFTVTVTDLALPKPDDITTPATSSAGAVVTYTPPTAVDEDGPAPAVTCDMLPGSTFPVGTTTVTCSATDSDSTPSTVSQTFTVTVTDKDLTLNKPADITQPATSSAGAVVTYTPPTAVDEDDSAPTVTCDMPPGSTFPVGPTTVTCSATDSDDTNSPAITTFTVTVTDTDLTLNKPDDITQPATSVNGAVVTYTPPTVVDEDSPLPPVTCDHPSGSTFPIGTTKVTCTVTDSDDSPGSASASFQVVVKDVTAPTLFLPPTFITNAATAAGTTVFYRVSATDPDNLGSQLTLGCTLPSGSTFPIGINTVTCTASDPYGNTTTGAFLIVVRGPVQTGAMGMSFWQKKTGQAIISSGASTNGVCNVATWLRQYAPFQDLSAKASCSKVASYVATALNKASNSSALADLLNGQMLATALDVYFSDPTLGGNQLKAPVPIGGVTIDLTYICTAPTTTSGGAPTCSGTYESTSSAFGGKTSLTISALLSALSSQFSNGTWYGGDPTETGLARDALAAINLQWAFAP